MWIRSAALSTTLLAALALCGNATAQSVMLTTDRPCYGAHQLISLTGYGFTPDSDVALSAEGQQLGLGMADYDGVFSAVMRAPTIPFSELALRFTATDQTYRLNRASVSVRLTSLGVRVTPTTGVPSRPRQIRARGFFNGDVLYAHVRRGDRTRNVRIGELRGPCRQLAVTRRLFKPGVRAGAYRLHFDTNAHFVARSSGRVTYAVTIAKASGNVASATSVTERWVQLAP